jgi:hypothetical protein
MDMHKALVPKLCNITHEDELKRSKIAVGIGPESSLFDKSLQWTSQKQYICT